MKPNNEWTERVRAASDIGEKITGAVEKAGLYKEDPHQLILGMLLASSVILMSSYADATDEQKTAVIKNGLFVEMASELTALAFGKIHESLQKLQAERN